MAGSIEKRGKDTYRLVVSCGYNLDGKPAKHTKTVHCTKKEAEVELAKFVTKVQSGMVADGKSMTFAEFTEIWKRDYGSKELAPTTYARYLGILNTRILPYCLKNFFLISSNLLSNLYSNLFLGFNNFFNSL